MGDKDVSVTGSETLGGWDVKRIERVLAIAVHRSCPSWLVADADDIVQAALLKILESVHRNKAEVNEVLASSYLWRVAYSCLIDEIRRHQRRREDALLDTNSLPHHLSASPVSDPERRAGSEVLAAAIRQCLLGLSEHRRQAVNLHLLGHSLKEVARLAGWDRKRADNLVHRGMVDLRRCLSKKGEKP
jgi:RNA polymerase sigma-70 factor (ECF subfamily)